MTGVEWMIAKMLNGHQGRQGVHQQVSKYNYTNTVQNNTN